MQQLANIQIVLCNTSHPGNIGSAARAMKTMGLSRLILVNPICYPDDHSLALAANAADIVLAATVVDTLSEALNETQLAIAMTGRKREFNQRLQTPKQIVPEIMHALQTKWQISIVFGNEQNGLSIDQLEKCNRLVTIPGNPAYCSLNLAQAVQIMSYEIYSNYNPELGGLQTSQPKASSLDIEHLLSNCKELLATTHYARNIDLTLRRIQQIIHKADLLRDEANLLQGLLRAIKRKRADADV